MNRFLRVLTSCAVVFAVACGDDEPTVSITVFQAAPDSIEIGQSTKLVFAVEPATAKVTISNVGDVTGKVQASVNPTVTTMYHLTATNGKATASADVTVTVGQQNPTAIKIEPASATPTAGDSLSVTVTAIAANGTAAPGYRGTVHLTSSDAQAVLPPDIVFAAADAGVKSVKVTLKTAGLETIAGNDTTTPTRRGSANVTVKAADAASCTQTQAPAAVAAGAAVSVSVVLHDAFNNVATGYAGTIKLTASDVRAVLPPDVTYVPATDAGSHAFSASLITAGTQTLTATDTVNAAIHCDSTIAVSPGAARLVLALQSNANAGFAVNVGVAVTDVFNNPVPGYTGTVTFTSSDTAAGAVTPAAIVFNGTEGGVASTSATFVTLGAQTLSAADANTPVAAGSASSTIHGLVYTAPTTGRVRLVANAAQSNTRVVQLDLVANERLEVSTFFGGGPGSFASGMNLPLDDTRVSPDVNLFTAGDALVFTVTTTPPTPPFLPIGTARIGSDHVLYSVVSRKRIATLPVFNQENDVLPGRVFYSLRLRLTQAGTVGPVFDGAQLGALFRASVRDQYGDDFVGIGDFGIGKLEIR